MFERFTDRARRVLVYAQDEARLMGHNFLGTEHLLLGMVKEGEGVAAVALRELGVGTDALRRQINQVVPAQPALAAGVNPPFTPRAKHVLELALKEALQLGHNYIGTEHLLLGLLREGEGVAAQVLVAAGLGISQVRMKVIELLSGYVAKPPPGAPGAAWPASTPAAALALSRATSAAGTGPLGSHHLLLALVQDGSSRAGRVLTALGATEAAVRDRISAIGPEGTSDEVPAATPATFELDLGNGLTLKLDPALAGDLFERLKGATAGSAEVDLGAAFRRVVADLVADQPVVAPEPEPPAAPTEGEES